MTNSVSTVRIVIFMLALLSGGMSRPALAEKRGFMLAVDTPTQVKADLERLASLKVKIVRFPIYLHNQKSLDVPLKSLTAILPTCNTRGITIVVDLHFPTRGVWGSQITNPDQFVNDWRTIATTMSGYSGEVWYDLANEQADTATWKWRALAQRAAVEIRKIEQRHAIIYSPTGSTTLPAATISKLDGITNQILEFHFWNWTNVQFDGVAYPSPGRTKADLERLLSEVAAAGRRNGCPVYIGEVGIRRDHPNAARFLRDFTDICGSLNIHCSVHAYRESSKWNYEGTSAWSSLTNWLARP